MSTHFDCGPSVTRIASASAMTPYAEGRSAKADVMQQMLREHFRPHGPGYDGARLHVASLAPEHVLKIAAGKGRTPRGWPHGHPCGDSSSSPLRDVRLIGYTFPAACRATSLAWRPPAAARQFGIDRRG
jgi:hypothetical protein